MADTKVVAVSNNFFQQARPLPRINLHRSSGAALAELAISFPLLILLTFGLFEVGRLFSQIPWVSQTLYEVVLEGAESPQGIGQSRMQSVMDQFKNILNVQFSGLTLTTSYEDITVGSQTERIVRARVGGSLIQLLNWTPYGMNIEFVAPYVANEPIVQNPNQFETLGTGYNCSFNPVGPEPDDCFAFNW